MCFIAMHFLCIKYEVKDFVIPKQLSPTPPLSLQIGVQSDRLHIRLLSAFLTINKTARVNLADLHGGVAGGLKVIHTPAVETELKLR